MFTESRSCAFDSDLSEVNQASRARHFSDSSMMQSSKLSGELLEHKKRQDAEIRRKIYLGNDWAVAEGLISVFMKVGQRDPHSIMFRKQKTQREGELDSDDHGITSSNDESKSPANEVMILGSSKQSFFIEKTVGTQSLSRSTRSIIKITQ